MEWLACCARTLLEFLLELRLLLVENFIEGFTTTSPIFSGLLSLKLFLEDN